MSDTAMQHNEATEEVTNVSPGPSPSELINEKFGIQGKAPLVQDQPITFYFKTPRKDPVTGKVPEDPDTGQPMKARPPLTLMLPIPTYDAILEMMVDGTDKHKNFIINTFADLIKAK